MSATQEVAKSEDPLLSELSIIARPVGADVLSLPIHKSLGRAKPRDRNYATDEDYKKIADLHLGLLPRQGIPAKAQAELFEMDTRALNNHSVETACLVYRGARLLVSSFISWLLAQIPLTGLAVWLVVVVLLYDETHLWLGMDDRSFVTLGGE